MKKKLNIFALLLISCSYTVFSQELKMYNGNYQGGIASYQYYENSDYERVFSGTFSYKNRAYDYSYFEQEITGIFKDNKKNGLWTAKRTRTISDVSFTEIISGKYEKGKKEGSWSYEVHSKKNGKIEITKELFNFKNNILVGEINGEGIIGSLSDKGHYIGKWNIKTNLRDEGEREYIAEFKNNVFLKLIVRQTSDGKILCKYDNSTLVNQLPDTLSIDENYTISGKKYELKYCDSLNKYLDNDNNEDNDNKDFVYTYKFIKTIFKKIGEFDKPLRDIPLGSSDYIINSPQILIVSEAKKNQGEITQIIGENIYKGLEIYRVVEQSPKFNGDDDACNKFIKENLKYPSSAIKNSISGTVFITFVVEPDGSLSNISLLRGFDDECNEEALRVVLAMPKWKPGLQRGKAVRVQYNLPIKFIL